MLIRGSVALKNCYMEHEKKKAGKRRMGLSNTLSWGTGKTQSLKSTKSSHFVRDQRELGTGKICNCSKALSLDSHSTSVPDLGSG